MSKEVVALIDTDIYIFKAASVHQQNFIWSDEEDDSSVICNLEAAINKLDEDIAKDVLKVKATKVICGLTDSVNWRNTILPSYKGNRKDAVRPLLLRELREYVEANYETFLRPSLECDDVLGILSTHPKLLPGRKVIISIDKDMKTIPGWLYNPDKDSAPYYIDEFTADWWHMYQTLCGDTTDGYSGCPGIGDKKARKALEHDDTTTSQDLWEAVVSLYKSKGLTQYDALIQAQVARICRYTEYDFKEKRVYPWRPS